MKCMQIDVAFGAFTALLPQQGMKQIVERFLLNQRSSSWSEESSVFERLVAIFRWK